MNKVDLINYISEQTELSKADATRALEAMIDGITTGLQQNGEVKLVGFGTFMVSQSAARTGRNPRTGEEIKIAASKSPKFKAGKQLKDSVNDNGSSGKKSA